MLSIFNQQTKLHILRVMPFVIGMGVVIAAIVLWKSGMSIAISVRCETGLHPATRGQFEGS